MNICNQLMFFIMMIFALASNISTGITSVCIVISAIIMMIQYIKTKKLPLQVPDRRGSEHAYSPIRLK